MTKHCIIIVYVLYFNYFFQYSNPSEKIIELLHSI